MAVTNSLEQIDLKIYRAENGLCIQCGDSETYNSYEGIFGWSYVVSRCSNCNEVTPQP